MQIGIIGGAIMGTLTPECIANHGKGRPLGSKNKKVTAAKLSQRYRELADQDNAPELLYEFWKEVMNNPEVRWSERLKASEQLAKRAINNADVETLTDAGNVVTSAEEALAILNGLDAGTNEQGSSVSIDTDSPSTD